MLYVILLSRAVFLKLSDTNQCVLRHNQVFPAALQSLTWSHWSPQFPSGPQLNTIGLPRAQNTLGKQLETTSSLQLQLYFKFAFIGFIQQTLDIHWVFPGSLVDDKISRWSSLLLKNLLKTFKNCIPYFGVANHSAGQALELTETSLAVWKHMCVCPP